MQSVFNDKNGIVDNKAHKHDRTQQRSGVNGNSEEKHKHNDSKKRSQNSAHNNKRINKRIQYRGKQHKRQNNGDIRIIRIFNTYGPRMHPQDGRVVSNFIVQALNPLDMANASYLKLFGVNHNNVILILSKV